MSMKYINWTQKTERIACKHPFIFKITTAYYRSMVRREIKYAGITSDDHVLCIGGGPCPYSALLIHSMTGAKVTVVDNDEASVRCSKRLLKRKGVEKYISVVLQDGECLDASNFSVIHIAAQITPKEKVFNAVWEKADEGSLILMRLPKHKLRKLYVHHDSHDSHDSSSFIYEDVSPREKVKHGLFANVGSTSIYVK
ncbi:hypothetical protein MmiAt1_02120 [Methanimicrococcus sp. At1]|uniref:Nicotianamine synthase protein n=1 Tax=Methanimicrococcus hacksteinii TaxID=3028293 RepID=A0ABU3VMP1_9EURY|nr:class I SAM-dependent methyltransferase [Methanimicrococcus sp. At1]MDV0444678.1 hypothetical protein [Methanimicrococcus sp. At1]